MAEKKKTIIRAFSNIVIASVGMIKDEGVSLAAIKNKKCKRR